MTRHDPTVSMRQMLDHAREAAALAQGRRREDLDRDRSLNLSLVRLMEIIGEAANRVPETERVRISCIPWPDIISLRNRLIHGYDAVDFDILWRIVRDDLPPLIEGIRKALAERGG